MLDYASLSALASVVREGSFERAARALHVTPSAISQRIRLLEERVGGALGSGGLTSHCGRCAPAHLHPDAAVGRGHRDPAHRQSGPGHGRNELLHGALLSRLFTVVCPRVTEDGRKMNGR